MLFTGLGRSVLGKTVPSVSSTRDLGHSFSQYGPPGRWITYICTHEIPIMERVLRDAVPLVTRSVIGERRNVRYNANNNTRKLETDNNLSSRSYTSEPLEVEVWKSHGITRFLANCNKNKIRLFSFSPPTVFPEYIRFHSLTFILWNAIFLKSSIIR